ncbi:MAG: hypothetical protein WCR67_01740 [Bacilli bacterium]
MTLLFVLLTKNKTARVETITSLETTFVNRNGIRNNIFIASKLDDVKKGNILPISKKQLKSKHYSGVNHKAKIVKLSKIHYKEPNDRTIFPKRYERLIKRK